MGIRISIRSSPVLPPIVLRRLVSLEFVQSALVLFRRVLRGLVLPGLVLPIVVGLSIVFPGLASAHHSRAEYTGEPIEFQGSLVDILWRNPHPAFTVEVDGNGQSQTWQVEGWSSLYTFDRAGITQDRFAPGDTVRVYGLASNRRPGRFLATHMLLADGTEAILRREENPYWGESWRRTPTATRVIPWAAGKTDARW